MDLVVSSYATALIAPAMPVIMAHGVGLRHVARARRTNDAFRYDRTVNISPTGGKMQEDFAKGFFEVAMTAEPKPKTVALAGSRQPTSRSAQMSSAQHPGQGSRGSRSSTTRATRPGPSTTAPIVRAIQAAKPDIVYFASYPPDSVGLLEARSTKPSSPRPCSAAA